MKDYKLLIPFFCAFLLSACGDMFKAPWDYFDNNSAPEAGAAIEATATFALALGGVANGRDALVIYDENNAVRDFSGKVLTFDTDNDNVELQVREGFADFAGGSGTKIIPKKPGVTVITYFVDGLEGTQKYKAIVPPQSLVQILFGEARGQIAGEAQVKDGFVELTSESPTANAIGAVVRNRVLLTESYDDFDLFGADEALWKSAPTGSYWDSIITASDGWNYQFSPVDPDNTSYTSYINTENRDNLTTEEDLIAYDQAVISASLLFDNQTNDPTGGAFAFRTPTAIQFACLQAALTSGTTILPVVGCGPGDDNYPAFAPVQILIHPSVALLSDGRASFVFYRNRDPLEPAVSNAP